MENIENIKKAIAVLEDVKSTYKSDSMEYEATELAIKALVMQQRMMEHCEGSTCTDCQYLRESCITDFIIGTNC